MGFSTPKKPFDLAEFLSRKGTPRNVRKPRWKLPSPTVKPTPEAVKPEGRAADETPRGKT